MSIPLDKCQYRDHEIEPHSGLIYRDPKHGIIEDIRICRPCYREHILRFYSGSKIAEHLREQVTDEQYGEQQHADDIDQQALYSDLRRGW